MAYINFSPFYGSAATARILRIRSDNFNIRYSISWNASACKEDSIQIRTIVTL